MLSARSDSSDRIHTTPAREMSDLPPSQIRITRVYRDLATTYLSHRLRATPRHSRKTPNHSSMSLPQLGRIERAVKAIVLPNSPGLLRLRKSSW